jgi:hypothetical protein
MHSTFYQYVNQGYVPNLAAVQARQDKIENALALQGHQTRIQQEKASLQNQRFFKDLEPEIDATLAQNPSFSVKMVFDYIKGQKMDELLTKETAAAKQRQLNNINGKSHIRSDGGSVDNDSVEVDPEEFKIAKALNPKETIESYRLLSKKVDYPLHVGVTESGTVWRGTIKSSVGIGALLADGIGDTIRVSLTGDPVEEIRVGREILKAAGYLESGVEFISCPTCGRTQIDLIKIANEVEEKLSNLDKKITVAVMGCAVNGPGEAVRADIGIAGGNGEGLIFKKGQIVRKVKEEDLVEELIKEIKSLQ